MQGLDPATERPATAVSHDGGRSWTYAVFDAEEPVKYRTLVELPMPTTIDGKVAYAVFARGSDRPRSVYRSDNGGRSWQRTNGNDSIPAMLAGATSTVIADGSHVLIEVGPLSPEKNAPTYKYVSCVDGGPYQPFALNGLPETARPPFAVTGGFYLSRDAEQIYGSSDGRTYRAIPLR